MGAIYSAEVDTAGTTVAIDFFELLAPSDAVVIIHEIRISQSTEFADAQAEQLEILVKRVVGAPTSGSGGATPTEQPFEFGSPAAGVVVEAGNTTKLTGGTQANLIREGFNVQIGWLYIPPPELRIVLSPDQRLVVELVDAPADAIDLHGVITWEEIGG